MMNKKQHVRGTLLLMVAMIMLFLSCCTNATGADNEQATELSNTVQTNNSTQTQHSLSTYSITITTPGDDSLPVNLQRHFYVGGNIISDSPVPDDAQVVVKLYNKQGEEVRSVASVCKGEDNLWLFHDKMFYSQEDDPERLSAKKIDYPEYIVEDMENPDASFNDASIKCAFTDDCYKAMIVYATDQAHGLIQDDGIGFVNQDGSPIDGLPEGTYTIKTTLVDANGQILAEAEKTFELANLENGVLGRFRPNDNYIKIMEMCEQYGLAGNSNLPGFVTTGNGDINGLRAMYANNDIALYANGKAHALIYYLEAASSSCRLELPYLQYAQRIGNPDTFQAYHYDIGEPVVRFNNSDSKELEGNIVPFESGDYMDVCRVDIVESNTPDNVFTLDGYYNKKSYTDLSNTIEVDSEETFAIAGVLCPYQLEKNETMKTADGLYKTTNDYCRLLYTIDDGEETYVFMKNPMVTKYTSNLTGKSALCQYEFYHVFPAAYFGDEGKTYTITIQALDYNMNMIEGASEILSIHLN